MGCCGRSRSALKESALNESVPRAMPPLPRVLPNDPSAADPSKAARAPAIRPGAAAVSVRYLERSSVVVHGPMTGRRYTFSAATPVQSVDARDAGAFWRTRFFRPA
jgi:hypothetical protein